MYESFCEVKVHLSERVKQMKPQIQGFTRLRFCMWCKTRGKRSLRLVSDSSFSSFPHLVCVRVQTGRADRRVRFPPPRCNVVVTSLVSQAWSPPSRRGKTPNEPMDRAHPNLSSERKKHSGTFEIKR